MIWKTSLLVRSKILGLFGTSCLPIMCILVINERNSGSRFKRYYVKNRKYFLNILLQFWNLHKILPIFKIKVSVIGYIFRKLFTLRNVVTSMPESSCFRTPCQSQSVPGSETLVKLTLQRFYPNFPLI